MYEVLILQYTVINLILQYNCNIKENTIFLIWHIVVTIMFHE